MAKRAFSPARALVQLGKRAELVTRLTETWVRRPSTPNRLVLDVTRRCNLRCSMCRTWKDERNDELSAPEIGDLMRQLPRLTWLDVTGGEPFLRKDAHEMFLTIAETTPVLSVLHFPTNGWFTRRVAETCEALVARRPEVQLIVTVSIDGPREVHDRIRGRAGSFDRAMETLSLLREMPGVDVYVGTTITPESEPTVVELGRVLETRFPDFRPSEWHWNRLQVSEHFFANGDLAGTEPRRPGLAREHLSRRGAPRSMVDLMELAFLVNLEFTQRGEPSGIPCQSLRSTAFVSPEGQLYPCHVWDRPLGSLREHSFAELWDAAHVLEARREVERVDCGGCFTPCEAYPALSGAPIATLRQTVRRSLALLAEP